MMVRVMVEMRVRVRVMVGVSVRVRVREKVSMTTWHACRMFVRTMRPSVPRQLAAYL